MRLVVLFLVAAVWLQRPYGGDTTSLHHLRPAKRSFELDLRNTSEYQAVISSVQHSMANGGLADEYFNCPEWKAFAAIARTNPNPWSEVNAIAQFKAVSTGTFWAAGNDYLGSFFDNLPWKRYKAAVKRPGFDPYDETTPEMEDMLAAAEVADMEDWRFRPRYLMEMNRLLQN